MEDTGHLLELLETLEAQALLLEQGKDPDKTTSVHRLFQSAHNLKSGLALAGFQKASSGFHSLEEGLDSIRRGKTAWSSSWADSILETVDATRAVLEAGPATRVPLRYRIDKLFRPGLTREDFESLPVYDNIQQVGNLLSVRPDWAAYSKATAEIVVQFVFSSDRTAGELEDLFYDPLFALPEDGNTGTQSKFRILVVEDDLITSEMIRLGLADFGDVTQAPEGNSGLAEFQKAWKTGLPFDVVVLDLEMPGLDGHGMLQALRAFEESVGVFGLDRCLVLMNTLNPLPEKVMTSFRLQADHYFIKPLSFDKIQQCFKDHRPWLAARRETGGPTTS